MANIDLKYSLQEGTNSNVCVQTFKELSISWQPDNQIAMVFGSKD